MSSESREPRDETAPRDARRAVDSLLPVVYEQLRTIARQRMASERKDHTLQATALVHEAYVPLSAHPASRARIGPTSSRRPARRHGASTFLKSLCWARNSRAAAEMV